MCVPNSRPWPPLTNLTLFAHYSLNCIGMFWSAIHSIHDTFYTQEVLLPLVKGFFYLFFFFLFFFFFFPKTLALDAAGPEGV